MPESAQMYPLLGLNLLFLLSQNRVAEFHIELELLPIDKILNNVYIQHPVSLEQYIMEGSYNKVIFIFQFLDVRANLYYFRLLQVHTAAHIVPDPTYAIFMESLIETLRNELARCLEKAYPKISIKGAMSILNLPNEKVLAQYSKTVIEIFLEILSISAFQIFISFLIFRETGFIRMDIICLAEMSMK